MAFGLNTDSGLGARAAGMGNSFTAAANDGYAMYYNPAGLALITSIYAGSTYSSYYSGLTDGTGVYEADICVAVPDKKSGFGFYWQETGLGSYYSEDTLAVGYAMRPVNRLAVGVSLKLRSVGYANNDWTTYNSVFSIKGASAFSADAGAIYNLLPGLNIGASAIDILQPNLGIADVSVVPMTLRGGLAWYPIANSRSDLLIAADGTLCNGTIALSAGVEGWVISKVLCVRGGYTKGQGGINQASGGAGMKLTGLVPGTTLLLDYSFDLALGYTDLGLNHRFSLAAVFDSAPAPGAAPQPVVEKTPEPVKPKQQGRGKLLK